MKNLLLPALLLVHLLVAAQPVQDQTAAQPYIEVSGYAEMEIIPDEIYVKVIIDEADNNVKKNLEELEKAFLKQLKDLDINVEDDLVILDAASNFKNYWLKKPDIFTSREYQLTIHDTQTLGRLFIDLEKAGISNISITNVSHSGLESYKKEVRIKAVRAAREKAASLANALDQSIGQAIYINDLNDRVYHGIQRRDQMSFQVMMSDPAQKSESERQPDIEFDKIKLISTIMVRFELK